MPGLRSPAGDGYGAAYGLGLFSGIASACCAPVLAGVVVLTGTAPSFGTALAVSLTYVAGMVAPLAVVALVWERRDWGSSRLLHGRHIRVGFGRLARSLPVGTVASGVVLIGMGIVTLVTAVTGPSMPNAGWQVSLAAWLQHVSSVISKALSWLPGWALLVLLAALAAALIGQARRSRRGAAEAAASTETVATATDDPDGPLPPVPSPPDIADSAEVTTTSARAGQEAVTNER